MKRIYFNFYLIIRLIIIAIIIGLNAFFAFKTYWYSFTFTAVLTLILIIEIIYFIYGYFSFNQKIINALLYNDFSLNMNLKVTQKNKSVLKLYDKIKKEHFTNSSKEILYQQLLNAIPSGFLILKEVANDRKIIFMNRYFQNLFDVPQSSSWNYLKKFIPQFCSVLDNSNFADQKTTLEIQINEEERQTYVIQNSKTLISGEKYDVLFLDSIQRVIDSTEKDAWMNVMKVIAHEIINSLTPIYSLAHSTKMYFDNKELTDEDYDDIRLSLDTIMNRSEHLQTFVEQYRKLTMLPTPIKTKQNLSEIINEVQHSFQTALHEKDIDFKNLIPKNITVNVDRIQFEQALINLIKNAISSLDDAAVKSIIISIKQTVNRIQIFIQDSGKPIDERILSKIFLPFYTTRKNGTGIGLTLSKSIIEAHNGYLYYQKNEGLKQFVVVLLI